MGDLFITQKSKSQKCDGWVVKKKKNGRISNHKEEIKECLEAWRKSGTELNSLKIVLQNQGKKNNSVEHTRTTHIIAAFQTKGQSLLGKQWPPHKLNKTAEKWIFSRRLFVPLKRSHFSFIQDLAQNQYNCKALEILQCRKHECLLLHKTQYPEKVNQTFLG